MSDITDYGLDLHGQMILDEYRENLATFQKMKEIIDSVLKKALEDNGILVTAVESRVKAEKSLAGKLELKGAKYRSLSDITDILGARIITFYTEDVDKVAALAESLFEIDWSNSVDKRKMHTLDSFGYMSLHYICRIPASMYSDPEYPGINTFWWELQFRTTLQHMWANMHHDTGYKSGVEVPIEYLRALNSLAGMLELADNEFSRIRTSINNYRREVNALVQDGKFDDVNLNGDTYHSYLKLHPFDKLTAKIAAVNQAEIHKTSLRNFLPVFKAMGFSTLGDLDNLIHDYSDAAYDLARYELGKTDLDIISSTIAVQDLCIVYILKNGGGEADLVKMFNELVGESPYNETRAKRIMGIVERYPLLKQK